VQTRSDADCCCHAPQDSPPAVAPSNYDLPPDDGEGASPATSPDRRPAARAPRQRSLAHAKRLKGMAAALPTTAPASLPSRAGKAGAPGGKKPAPAKSKAAAGTGKPRAAAAQAPADGSGEAGHGRGRAGSPAAPPAGKRARPALELEREPAAGAEEDTPDSAPGSFGGLLRHVRDAPAEPEQPPVQAPRAAQQPPAGGEAAAGEARAGGPRRAAQQGRPPAVRGAPEPDSAAEREASSGSSGSSEGAGGDSDQEAPAPAGPVITHVTVQARAVAVRAAPAAAEGNAARAALMVAPLPTLAVAAQAVALSAGAAPQLLRRPRGVLAGGPPAAAEPDEGPEEGDAEAQAYEEEEEEEEEEWEDEEAAGEEEAGEEDKAVAAAQPAPPQAALQRAAQARLPPIEEEAPGAPAEAEQAPEHDAGGASRGAADAPAHAAGARAHQRPGEAPKRGAHAGAGKGSGGQAPRGAPPKRAAAAAPARAQEARRDADILQPLPDLPLRALAAPTPARSDSAAPTSAPKGRGRCAGRMRVAGIPAVSLHVMGRLERSMRIKRSTCLKLTRLQPCTHFGPWLKVPWFCQHLQKYVLCPVRVQGGAGAPRPRPAAPSARRSVPSSRPRRPRSLRRVRTPGRLRQAPYQTQSCGPGCRRRSKARRSRHRCPRRPAPAVLAGDLRRLLQLALCMPADCNTRV